MSLGEIPDLVTVRGTLPSDHRGLVIAIEVNMKVLTVQDHALKQLVLHVRIARYRRQSRKPVEPRDDAARYRAGRNMSRPLDDRRGAEPAVHDRSLRARER